jgi:DNA gyrase/topoisomerase IV subunit A
MTFSEKIDEWIKEAETRPGSALMILKLIAGRMRDLTERNEELLAENIALQDGSRVEEYQRRITYLEFQLDLLKRRFGSNELAPQVNMPKAIALSLLIYNSQGRILRFELVENELAGQANLGKLADELIVSGGELPRILAISTQEEVLLLFSSGRVSTHPVADIPVVDYGGSWNWEQGALPDEPHAGELLVGMTPLSRLPVSVFILQASRRGYVKKTLSSISDKVLADHYLGRGTLQKSDHPFEVTLCPKKARFILVTYEGRLLVLDVDAISFAAEERIRLNGQDHVVAAFVLGADESILCLTQNGKVVQRGGSSLEMAKSPAARGQALIPPSRLEQGTRFVGAVSFRDKDRLVVLDGQGNLSTHLASEVCGAGSLHKESVCVVIGLIPATGNEGSRT